MSAPEVGRQRGYSLVSLMVGLVISLLVGLSAMGALQSFTLAQRQASGVGNLLSLGVQAESILKFEISQAARGLYLDGRPLCNAVNLSVEDDVLSNGQELRPIDLSWNDSSELTLDVRYGHALEGAAVATLTSPLAEGVVQLASRLRVKQGQAVLLMPPEGQVGTCTVRTVTAISPSDSMNGLRLTFGSDGTHNKMPFESEGSYPEGSRVVVWGKFAHTRFSVRGRDLVMARPLEKQEAVIATGVRAFNVELGHTDGVTEGVSKWTAPRTQADWQNLTEARTQLRAIRTGLILQSTQRDKPDPEGKCSATQEIDAPVIFGDKLKFEDGDACFKYRSFFTVVPLRNLFLSQAAS